MGCWGTESVIWDLGEEGAALNLPPKRDSEDNLAQKKYDSRNSLTSPAGCSCVVKAWLRMGAVKVSTPEESTLQGARE